jgi:uncharacterized membrane protein
MYLLLKALHVAAMLLFVGGLFALIVWSRSAGSDGDRRFERAVHGWNRAVTTPALAATWALGLALALEGDWLRFGWLQAKLALVLVLSGLHGVLSGALRRSLSTAPRRVGQPRWIALMVPLALVAIAMLAVMKP